jgi:Toprim domain
MISDDLLARARDTDLLSKARALGARLKRVTASELAGPCLKCGGTDRFSINVKLNVWYCRHCVVGGADALSLVMHVNGFNFRKAVEFLTGEVTTSSPQATARTNGALAHHLSPKPSGAKPDEESNAFVERMIADIVRELGTVEPTPGARYLAKARKIDTNAIADVLRRTDAIGWHPSVLFREKGHALDGQRLGAIIGVMTDPVTAKPTGAISRTYLSEGRKIGPAKTLGRPPGIVRLSADEDVLLGLHLAEGLETSLDAMAKGFRPIWSTGSANLMASFPVLTAIECITVFADNDPTEAGLRAANEVAERWRAADRETHVYQRETIGDFNDAFRGAAP